jgi:hypothetical protein
VNAAANVQAIELLLEWHAGLVEFRTDAMEALAAVTLEINRAAGWIDEKYRTWKQAVRDADNEIFIAKQELNNRRYPDFSGKMPDTSEQRKVLRKAQAKKEFAENQVEVCRKWMQKLPHMVEEVYEGPARMLSGNLEGEMPKALAMLQRRITALEAYAAIAPPSTPAESAPPPTVEPPAGGTPS